MWAGGKAWCEAWGHGDSCWGKVAGMPTKQWPAARNAWSRLAGPTTNELVPELGSTESFPEIAGRVELMPRAGGCAMARWGRGWVSAPAQHRDHLRAVPPACRARHLTRNLTRLTGWKSVKRPPARLADRSGPLVFAELEAMLEARARSRSISVLLCMQFSVKVGCMPISYLISSYLLAAEQVVVHVCNVQAVYMYVPRENNMDDWRAQVAGSS